MIFLQISFSINYANTIRKFNFINKNIAGWYVFTYLVLIRLTLWTWIIFIYLLLGGILANTILSPPNTPLATNPLLPRALSKTFLIAEWYFHKYHYRYRPWLINLDYLDFGWMVLIANTLTILVIQNLFILVAGWYFNKYQTIGAQVSYLFWDKVAV